MMVQIGLFAQNVNVKGTVKANDGSTLPGANIAIKGTSQGTTTGANGRFSILAPANGTPENDYTGSLKIR